jgi:teichuronic acid biosynthesis glycosyltransferase TuaC
MLRLLTFTTLFPNAEQPNHGIFVENRLRHLLTSAQASSEVVAPVPFFPSGSALFGSWGRLARVPRHEVRHGIEVYHPRYPVIPRVGMSLAPMLLYRAMARFLDRLLVGGAQIDAIDAHYLYPDGVAALWLGRRLGVPVVITARGTDVNLIPRYRTPRRLIRGAMTEAAALIAVSAALKAAMVELGAPADKVTVLRNGVETAVFKPPADRSAARAALGLTRPTLISVGHLIERKGHHLVIEALRDLPDWELIVVGEGPEQPRLVGLTRTLGLGDRVRLLGARPHAELPALYAAADALVLASSREGWANVLLESMACGTPVVATNIWGNPEVVQDRAAGVIVERSAQAIAQGVRQLAAGPADRAATRAYAERFSWDETTAGQLALFRRVVDDAKPSPGSLREPPPVQVRGRLSPAARER